ncbi:MAG TPA: hypothetical protein VGF67_04465 [Ktedonobacteraceae bacterium]|jgi:hypothetical protein
MQHPSSRRGKTSVYLVRQTDEAILHLKLENLLPEDQTLALNTRLGTLALLATNPENLHPELLTEQQFSSSEMSVLVPLLRSHPHYCPYEVLLASFNCGNTTDTSIERYRLRLQEAQFAGVWDYEMRPVRNILSRTRFKLRDFGIEISSILETGYILIYLPMRRTARES